MNLRPLILIILCIVNSLVCSDPQGSKTDCSQLEKQLGTLEANVKSLEISKSASLSRVIELEAEIKKRDDESKRLNDLLKEREKDSKKIEDRENEVKKLRGEVSDQTAKVQAVKQEKDKEAAKREEQKKRRVQEI